MPLATALIVAGGAAYGVKKQYDKKKKKQAGDGTVSDDDDADEEGGAGVVDAPPPPPEDIHAHFLEDKTSVELLPLEQSLSFLEWPTATVSFYRRASSAADASVEDLDAALDKLQRRVEAILNANPWLGGWLVRGKGIGASPLDFGKVPCKLIDNDKATRLWYDPTGEEQAPGIFQKMSHEALPLDVDTPYKDYERILLAGDAAVKTNPEIVNRRGEPVFRATVVPSPDDDGFALVASMSHVAGDAHSFYRVYNMIAGSEPIVALNPQRDADFRRKVHDVMGGEASDFVSRMTTDPAFLKVFGKGDDEVDGDDDGSDLRGRVFLVDRDWVANFKRSSEGEGRVSTNDVLVSWFWNLIDPDVGLMSVDFRGRVDTVTDSRVGNYATPVPYAKEDYKTPALIRKSVEKCRRAAKAALPRARPDLTVSVVTNWSSFHREEGTGWSDGGAGLELVRHVPVLQSERIVESMPKRMSLNVIFSGGPEDVGCVLIAPGRVMEEIDTCGVVKVKIADF
ncbi:hypothetical protein ACHAWF_015239 [Thalassiosira exigua]